MYLWHKYKEDTKGAMKKFSKDYPSNMNDMFFLRHLRNVKAIRNLLFGSWRVLSRTALIISNQEVFLLPWH